MKKRFFNKLIGAAAISVSAILALGGCSAQSSSSASSTNNSTPLTVWVDAARVPAVKAFEKKYPKIKVKVSTIANTGGTSGLEQKFSLYNQAGSGWPDVVFLGSIDDIAWAASAKIDYAADLTNLLPASYKAGYSKASIGPCVIDGKWRCVRNDEAQDVLWYNKSLLDSWGYTVPTTWPEYEALGNKIATEHPGYYSGLIGDALATDRYLWPSGCPTNELVKSGTVKIALSDKSCTRVRDLLDSMLESKAISVDGVFDSATATSVGPKLAMTPGATWYGDYLFRDTFKIPAGQMAAAAPLTWPGDGAATGDEGGGLWVMSKHISGSTQTNALKVLNFMTTDPSWQVKLSTGFPAYGPVQQAWLNQQIKDGYFADPQNLSKIFIDAGKVVQPSYTPVLYNTGDIWTQVVTPGLVKGQSVGANWDAFQAQLVAQAKTFSYTVQTK